MATRKTKRYDEGGDVLGRLMGRADDSIGPRDTGYMDEPINRRGIVPLPRYSMEEDVDRPMPVTLPQYDEPPMKRGNNDELAGQVTKVMGGSARGAGDGIPLGQQAMGTSGNGIPAAGVSNAKTALQDIKKTAKDAMVEELISGMSKRPQVAKIKSSYGGYGDMGGFSKGGSVSKASSRADGIAQRGKTRGTMR